MASCIVTVIGSAQELVLDKTDIVMNVGDTETIAVDYLPKNTTAQLTWKASKDNLLNITWDEERKLAILNAKAPGDGCQYYFTSGGRQYDPCGYPAAFFCHCDLAAVCDRADGKYREAYCSPHSVEFHGPGSMDQSRYFYRAGE